MFSKIHRLNDIELNSLVSVEKPLGTSSKLALFCEAGAAIFLCYVFSIASILFLFALTACEFVLVFTLARVGLAGVMARILGDHLAVLSVFCRSFWLRKGLEFRIPLHPADAPGLFAMLEKLCQRAEVPLPDEVSLEMNVNAWVRLNGYGRGSGRTILGMGYDLLAGLSEAEVGAVLAHEIMHAKLVRRGYKRWINGGLRRSAQLANGLSLHIETARRAKNSSGLANRFLSITDSLTRWAARLVAGCSRQDEFSADCGAARISGAGSIRSALVKVESLSLIATRLPWRERVAQLQSGVGFGQWLIEELATADQTQSPQAANAFSNKYSTHPTLKDRLAALPEACVGTRIDANPGLGLLAEPDAAAEKLISEIQRTVAEQEQRDTKLLRRWTRRRHGTTQLRPLQLVGVVLAILGLGGLIVSNANGISVGPGAIGTICATLGLACYRFGRYHERLTLPVPEFGVLKSAWQNKPEFSQDQVRQLELELRASVAAHDHQRRKAFALASACYAALGRCDYVRAHVAARLCLDVKKDSAEGALGLAVSASALGQPQEAQWALNFLQKSTGITGGSTVWGAAWALLLCGDSAPAEAFVELARQKRPDDPTLLALLALSQAQRGKLQSAILNARRACALEPICKEREKLLIDLLLQAGYLREARERLHKLETEARQDRELTFSMVRLNLLSRNLAAAATWTELLKKSSADPHMLVRLGEIHELARQHEKAVVLYHEALAAAHYPEALLGLGRLDAERKNRVQAKRHVLAALDITRPVGKKGVGTLPLFGRILGQLVSLEDPIPNCRAWIAKLSANASPAALANTSFVIYSPGRLEAEESLRRLLDAMQPGLPPILPAAICWREAPKEQQPDGPIRPGVQAVLS
jgi:Zn-dependent protease with chaperone function/tetratricopeptide (TPR) repeat protein